MSATTGRVAGGRAAPDATSEAAFAAWWAAGGAVGAALRLADGRLARVRFPGRPGGPAGPDFRDAVAEIAGRRVVGDVELHLRGGGWRAHGHDRDPRYDGVKLHVVRGAATETESPLAAGGGAPVAALNARLPAPGVAPAWPCQTRPAPDLALWRHLGAARFAGRVARFRAELSAPGATLEAVLALAVAEALGYGRDPLATRAAWLGAGDTLDALDARRLAAWRQRAGDVAARATGALLAGGVAAGWPRLLAIFAPAVGDGRAAIVVWNVVLPCLAAFGDQRGAVALAQLARRVAATAPGLPSNAITRHMAGFLGVRRAPAGALAQQGLHHLRARWCREKHCATCPLGASHQPARQFGDVMLSQAGAEDALELVAPRRGAKPRAEQP